MGDKKSQTITRDNEYIPAASKKGFNLHLLEVADLHLLEVVGDLQLGDQGRTFRITWRPPWFHKPKSRNFSTNLRYLHHRIIWEVVWCHMTISSSSNILLKLRFHPGNGPLTITTATTPPTRKKWYETKDYLLGTGSIKCSHRPFFQKHKTNKSYPILWRPPLPPT